MVRIRRSFPVRRLSPKEAIARAEELCDKLRKMTLPPTNWNMSLEEWRSI
jgi:hypothetical protein